MKKQNFLKVIFISFIMICLSLISCEPTDSTEENTPPPDPAGTITTNLTGTAGLIIWQGTRTDNQPTTLYLGMNVPSVNTWIYFWYGGNNHMNQGETADLGEVKGLGNVIEIPTTGYTFQCALMKGHGYVIRYQKEDSYSSNSSLPYFYSRYYVVDYLTDIYDGIIGVNIKYQGPF
jgi:hypothetical protein